MFEDLSKLVWLKFNEIVKSIENLKTCSEATLFDLESWDCEIPG